MTGFCVGNCLGRETKEETIFVWPVQMRDASNLAYSGSGGEAEEGRGVKIILHEKLKNL